MYSTLQPACPAQGQRVAGRPFNLAHSQPAGRLRLVCRRQSAMRSAHNFLWRRSTPDVTQGCDLRSSPWAYVLRPFRAFIMQRPDQSHHDAGAFEGEPTKRRLICIITQFLIFNYSNYFNPPSTVIIPSFPHSLIFNFYSLLRLSVGFANAALRDWALTASNAISSTTSPDIANIHHAMSIWYAKSLSHNLTT